MFHSFFSHRVTAVLTAGVIVFTALLSGCDKSPLTVKVGVAQPLTGNLAPLGTDLLNGVKMAIEELNKEGILVQGRTVMFEVVPVDDRASVETGKEVARQLVEAGVVAVIGHLNSGVSIAAAPIYAEARIPQMAISTNPKFTQLGFDTVFRLVANDTLQAKAIGSFASTQFPATRYAVLDDGTPYGVDLAAGSSSELQQHKKEIVLQKSLNDQTKDFDDLALKIKEAKVEVIISTMADFQVQALIDALKAIQYTEVRILGGDTIKTPQMLARANHIRGLMATSPVMEASEFAAGKAFLTKYRSKYNVDPAYAGHYTYDAMYVLSAAIRRAESVKPSEIAKMLHKIDGYAPVTGAMRWDKNGELRYGVIGVYSASNDQWNTLVRSDVW